MGKLGTPMDVQPVRKCRFCGQAIRAVSRVCEHCGKDLIGPSASRSADPADPEIAPAPLVRVTVVDVDVPFGSLVSFMVKGALASIPAFLLLFGLFVVVGLLFGGMFASCKIPGR